MPINAGATMPNQEVRSAVTAGRQLVRTMAASPAMSHQPVNRLAPLPQYTRDMQKSWVYAAEQQYDMLVQQRHTYPQVKIQGVALDVPDTLNFGDLAAVQRFVDRVTEHHGASRISVRTSDRLTRAAEYAGGWITLPLGGDHRWAWRISVVLHEITHHLTSGLGHGSPFPGTLVEMFETWISPQAGLLLRLLYVSHDVQL